MRIVCRETLVHRFDQLGIDFALADKCACRFLSFRKKGGAVLEAVLCMAGSAEAIASATIFVFPVLVEYKTILFIKSSLRI